MEKAIVFATPVFFLLIAIEWAWGRARGASNYRVNDAVNSLSLGVFSEIVKLFTLALRIGIYAVVFSYLAVWQLPEDAWWVWVFAVVFYDFCYYWNHRLGHESAIFWASHVVHHQSQEYNLTTALRQTGSGMLLGWIFYLPMAIVGIPPKIFAFAAIVDLLYQYWIHTEHVGKLGWFDRVFASPSNHRVHHAVNDRYIDRNYGGIFMLWDRMFGTFTEETEKCVYGTRSPLNSWDPLWANLEVYADLARKSRSLPRWRDKLLVWFMPPGWMPAAATGVKWQKPHFDVARLERYDPPMTSGMKWFAALGLTAMVFATLLLQWFAAEWPVWKLAAWAIAVTLGLWLIGAVMQRRIAIPRALAIQGTAMLVAVVLVGG
jgi:sterol desaturase/sphingolipid hydroxylase (fatty acid hydroxylase superfamily)